MYAPPRLLAACRQEPELSKVCGLDAKCARPERHQYLVGAGAGNFEIADVPDLDDFRLLRHSLLLEQMALFVFVWGLLPQTQWAGLPVFFSQAFSLLRLERPPRLGALEALYSELPVLIALARPRRFWVPLPQLLCPALVPGLALLVLAAIPAHQLRPPAASAYRRAAV